jgi:hypothetical protein
MIVANVIKEDGFVMVCGKWKVKKQKNGWSTARIILRDLELALRRRPLKMPPTLTSTVYGL